MECNYVLEGKNITKKYKNFKLDIENLQIPKGFATALIGENGAGKTTLLDILAGIKLDYKGSLKFFGQYNDKDREKNPDVKNRIGYLGTGNYFFPSWTLKEIEELQGLLFDNFDLGKYREICNELALYTGGAFEKNKKVNNLSDGNKVKLMLAGILARETDLLLMDEPASPLDPLMRDKLCNMLRNYISENEGERSVLFSTHNISDMESITDYVIIVEQGRIVEQGFAEDLKEKYIVVKGEKKDEVSAAKVIKNISTSSFGFEGICLAEDIDKLSGMDIAVERPTLSQISVHVMKEYSLLGEMEDDKRAAS
ncbi:ATP-binding cassette domain-containing protein [Butyrivibrio sp. NC2002]|uniref:ATP-binding cassette domain-containing protein n=1 Tax=Butyrivibrio sp. NC2002 TaxID=1410610 RepID=UPI0005614CAD|nr:ABC transporter ATP-binding protein [Butyrivibrio sp. NC2002]